MKIRISTDPHDAVLSASKSSTISIWCVLCYVSFKYYKNGNYPWEKFTLHFIESLNKNVLTIK